MGQGYSQWRQGGGLISSKIEKTVGNLKENQAKLSKQLNEAIRVRDSSDAVLKNAEKQVEEQCK